MPATGSDTRMYSPRSESNLGYSKDDDYPHGIGDPEEMEAYRDKQMAEKEKPTLTDDLPHLQLSIPRTPPPMPSMPPMEEEEPAMDDQFNEGQQFGAMTGMPDMGNLSIGNATGTMPAPGGMLATGEPMEHAWSSLMKARLDDAGTGKDKTWSQPKFETQPGGSDITTATSRRSKAQSRALGGGGKKRGLDLAPLSVDRTHLGVATKQPLRLFPEQYGHQRATQQRRRLMGNVPQAPAGHGLGPERTYQPRGPKVAVSGQTPMKEPMVPREKGQGFAKSMEGLREDIEALNKAKDYLQFSQIRRLLRQLKDATERQERRLKAAAPGENREAGHREGQDSTTKPEGATENLEDDPKNWGAPSTLFAARGSGRVG